MTTANLIRWIDSHDRPEPTLDNGDGTLTVASTAVLPELSAVTGEHVTVVEHDTIPATMRAARDLLGY